MSTYQCIYVPITIRISLSDYVCECVSICVYLPLLYTYWHRLPSVATGCIVESCQALPNECKIDSKPQIGARFKEFCFILDALNVFEKGSGCGSVVRVVASDTSGRWIESTRWQMNSLNSSKNDKEAANGIFLNVFENASYETDFSWFNWKNSMLYYGFSFKDPIDCLRLLCFSSHRW